MLDDVIPASYINNIIVNLISWMSDLGGRSESIVQQDMLS